LFYEGDCLLSNSASVFILINLVKTDTLLRTCMEVRWFCGGCN